MISAGANEIARCPFSLAKGMERKGRHNKVGKNGKKTTPAHYHTLDFCTPGWMEPMLPPDDDHDSDGSMPARKPPSGALQASRLVYWFYAKAHIIAPARPDVDDDGGASFAECPFASSPAHNPSSPLAGIRQSGRSRPTNQSLLCSLSLCRTRQASKCARVYAPSSSAQGYDNSQRTCGKPTGAPHPALVCERVLPGSYLTLRGSRLRQGPAECPAIRSRSLFPGKPLFHWTQLCSRSNPYASCYHFLKPEADSNTAYVAYNT